MEQESTYPQPLYIDPQGLYYMAESAKWSKMLGILGFIASGAMVLVNVLIALFFSAVAPLTGSDALGFPGGQFMSGGIMGMYIIVGLIYFLPSLYLYRFGLRTQQAIRSNDQGVFTSGLGQMRAWFRFAAVIAILGMAILVFALFLMLVLAISFGSR